MATGERRGVRGVRFVAGVLVLVPVAGVCIRAADAKDDVLCWPGVVVPVVGMRDDDLFGLGDDTALVSDSKKEDMVYACTSMCEIDKRCFSMGWKCAVSSPQNTQDVSVMMRKNDARHSELPYKHPAFHYNSAILLPIF